MIHPSTSNFHYHNREAFSIQLFDHSQQLLRACDQTIALDQKKKRELHFGFQDSKNQQISLLNRTALPRSTAKVLNISAACGLAATQVLPQLMGFNPTRNGVLSRLSEATRRLFSNASIPLLQSFRKPLTCVLAVSGGAMKIVDVFHKKAEVDIDRASRSFRDAQVYGNENQRIRDYELSNHQANAEFASQLEDDHHQVLMGIFQSITINPTSQAKR